MEIKSISGKDVAALLHHIHFHNDETEQILYPHHQLLEVLQALGISIEDAASFLFPIHTHYPYDSLDMVYYENDLLPLLKEMGLPYPEWHYSMSIEDWKRFKEKFHT